MRKRLIGGLVAGFCWVLSTDARAQEVVVDDLPMVTDSDFAIDLYLGPVLGSGRIVGMGGAAVSLAEGSAGMLANPAAPAVRPSTSNDKWAWDWHADWLSPQAGDDFDGNGIATTEELEILPFLTFGIVGNYKHWALGISVDQFQQQIGEIDPTFAVVKVSLARTFMDDQLAVGLGTRAGSLSVTDDAGNSLFDLTGGGLELGAVWKPSAVDIRVGSAVSFPVVGDKTTPGDDPACTQDDCFGYVLPDRVVAPWRLATGISWRRAATRWNRKVDGHFRDEKALTLSGDLVITGKVPDGYGIEAFANTDPPPAGSVEPVPNQRLQPSGRRTVASVRLGVEYEWKPGRFRVRGGTYYEPARFKDAAGNHLRSRQHLTLGADLRIYSFRLWGDPYRVRLSLTADGAENYANGGLSIGFWH